LGTPIQFTVTTPEETSKTKENVRYAERLAAQAALQVLPSWLSALSQDDLAKLKERHLEHYQRVNSKGLLHDLLFSALGKHGNTNFTMISKDNSTGEWVVEIALRVVALEEGGAPLEFKGVASTSKAAEQQAAQAALAELEPMLKMLALKRRTNATKKDGTESKAKIPKQVAGAKAELSAEIKAALKAAAEAAVKAAMAPATPSAKKGREELSDKAFKVADDIAREIVARLDTEGKSVELELSGSRLMMLLPALARLPERLQASAQLLPAEGIAGAPPQHALRVTRDAPLLGDGAKATKVADSTDPEVLARSLQDQLDGMTRGELEQSSGTIGIVFSGTGETAASAKAMEAAIKALSILQGSFSKHKRFVKFASRYTFTELEGMVRPSIAVAVAVA